MKMRTRFTKGFGLSVPVALAPMAGVSGGALAAAVSRGGGLGILGGGYGDLDWIRAQWALAQDAPIGIGFITWKLTEELLAEGLALGPRAVFLSFGDPRPHAARIHAAEVPLICQCTTLAEAERALEAGAHVIVAQGAEAGGHGAGRGTMALVPEIADLIATRDPSVVLLAAGGIADGRGLAAALVLGAEGAVMGSRFCLSREALMPAGFKAASLTATGDETVRGRVPDVARGLAWPEPYNIRTLATPFIRRWGENLKMLGAAEGAGERAIFVKAQADGDPRRGAPIIGEAVGLIGDLGAAEEILATIAQDAGAALGRFAQK